MIRLNIIKNGKVTVKSFINKIDLDNYVLDFIGADKVIGNFTNVANKIWNLNVGTSMALDNGFNKTIISIIGKSPYHNTDHGKQMYGS